MQAVFSHYLSDNPAKEIYEQQLQELEQELVEGEKQKGQEGDVRFMQTLFNTTITSRETYDKYISEKSQNWLLERIAWTDRVLMHLAICESLNFPNIQLRVTMNEYIEIAKQFSTPESGKFINGVLDRLFREFQEKGYLADKTL